MRISKIYVEKLFGMFNHEITMNDTERITIIHAPNGFGKTTILKLIKSVLENDLIFLNETAFEKLVIEFDDKSKIIIKKVQQDGKDDEFENHLIYTVSIGDDKKYYTTKFPLDKKYFFNIIHREVPYLRRINSKEWLDRRSGKRLKYGDILSLLNKEDLYPLNSEEETPDWFSNYINDLEQISVRFVQAQRLIQIQQEQNKKYVTNKRYSTNESDDSKHSVTIYSNELKNKIETKLAESASLSQDLDRSFPTRLIEKMMNLDESDILTQESIDKELSELEQKRSNLEEVGLLYKGASTTINDNKNKSKMDEHTRSVLTLYINDTKEKLKVFEDLQQKIKLMKDIINRRFINKEMSINKEKGIVFTLPSGRTLKPDKLSSGEQHELVILYELLFKSAPKSLILIDEPEISLHVMWQQQFLNDLLEISKLTDIDIIIATHSPQIIHDRWDLTVGLE